LAHGPAATLMWLDSPCTNLDMWLSRMGCVRPHFVKYAADGQSVVSRTVIAKELLRFRACRLLLGQMDGMLDRDYKELIQAARIQTTTAFYLGSRIINGFLRLAPSHSRVITILTNKMAANLLSNTSFCHSSPSTLLSRSSFSSSSPTNMGIFKRLKSMKKSQNSDVSPDAQVDRVSSSMASKSSNTTPAPRNPFATPTYINSGPTRRPATLTPAASTDAPPPYTPPNPSGSDDRYTFLRTFDTVFLIDDSGSMAGRSWRETGEALEAIAPICTAYDADGIDIYFLNAPQQEHFLHVVSARDVQRIFREQKPYGGTPTGSRLNKILRPYLRELETKGVDNVKPLNIIVITDGVPSDDVESVIMATARKLEKLEAPAWQIGIQFFQVGNEAGAAEALKELDDELVNDNCPRDIVDTVPFNPALGGLSADGVLKVVLGAVNRKLDRKRNSAEEMRT
jgi:hypothetical protein